MKLPPHATVGDLRVLIHRRQFASIKDRMAAVIMRRQGRSLRTIAAAIGRSADFVMTWNARYRREGANGLYDRQAKARATKLSDDQLTQFRKRVIDGPTKGDGISAFRIPDLQSILRREFGVEYSRSAISKMLRRLGLARLRPRPRHEKNDVAKMAEWRQQTGNFQSK